MLEILKIKINFLNKTNYQVSKLKIKKIVFDLLKEKKINGNFEIGVRLISLNKIKEFNNRYRQINFSTDVLSFPTLTKIDSNENFLRNSLNNLGDIIICPDFAKKNVKADNLHKWKILSKKFKTQKINKEIYFLTHHGLLHLIGIHHKES